MYFKKSIMIVGLAVVFLAITGPVQATTKTPELPVSRKTVEATDGAVRSAALPGDKQSIADDASAAPGAKSDQPDEPRNDGTAKPASKADPEAGAKARTKTKPNKLMPTLHARIDLTQQRMTVSADGKTLHSWKISSGRDGYETPTGTFRPQWMARDWHSRKYDMAPMPYSVFFNGGIATHGTTAIGRLGRPASHGCIRLKTPNARRFYNLVRKHGKTRTRISVVGTTPATGRHYAKKRPPARRTVRRVRPPRYQTPPRVVYRRVWRYPSSRSYGYQPRVGQVYRPAPPPRLVYPGDRPRIIYRRAY